MGKALLYILALCLFVASFILGYHGNNIPSGTFILAAIVVMFICNIDKFSEFKVANISATIKRAENTLSELHLLAAELSSVSLWSLQSRWYIGNYDETRESFFNRQISLLYKLEVPVDKIEEIKNSWHNYVKYTYTLGILRVARKIKLHEKSGSFTEFDKAKEKFYNDEFEPTPVAELRVFLGQQGVLTDKIVQYVDAYEFYTKNNKHKSKELWLERDMWNRY